MVGVFRRSFSFPNKSPSKPSVSHHVRSISLPCRSHPLIFQLRDEIASIKTWSSTSDSRTSAWLCDGLNSLKVVHNHLDDILNLPQTQESLRGQPEWIDKLLEHFLRFVDVYGIFQTLILALKEEHSAAQVALRRKDEQKIVLYVKSRKRIAQQMVKLVSTIQRQKIRIPEQGGDTELAVMIEEVKRATVSVSVALFNGIAQSFGTRKTWAWAGLGLSKKTKGSVEDEKGIQEFREIGSENLRELRKKGKEEMKMAMKKMQDMEDWIGSIETRSQRVFRSFISARVSLLNALSQQASEN